ncbi:uncharacterized protein LOC126054365 isoform X1 [Helicoverpa armigera]|uniref:uncharacterized protein LOC126054365 isoform X1 n=1 Tax=Helicoverpa armigera TaxID=29058 RepID=UPI0021131C5D|nr:uncharacterized protein LOC110381661 isoform X1 [Helicoverpa armigera]
MEKPKITKIKKAKTLARGISSLLSMLVYTKLCSRQITYPAPYAQSWNIDTTPVLTRGYHGKGPKVFLFNNPKKRADTQKTWSQSYSAVRGPDPTAPHLKYGVFPNRRASSTRNLPKPPLKPNFNPHCPREEARSLISNKTYPVPARKKPVKKVKGQQSDSPMLVIRALDKTFTKQLSLSEIMHVDIKPGKRIPGTPSFCPPNYKGLSPKLMSIRTPG